MMKESEKGASSGSETGLFPINKKYLLFVAGLVWVVAGANVLRIGLLAAEQAWQAEQILMALAVFAGFMTMFVFIVRKNAARIMAYQEEKVGIFRFFNIQGYIMMAFMMSLGIGLRYADVVPLSWIMMFYTGLGTALTIAGLLFLLYLGKGRESGDAQEAAE